jgi:type II pantothenate kinase
VRQRTLRWRVYQKEGKSALRPIIGIDAGGTLIKIVDQEKGALHFHVFPSDDPAICAQWLRGNWPGGLYGLTGGGAARLSDRLRGETVRTLSEFDATCDGAIYLLKRAGRPVPTQFVLTNCGTGTSIHIVRGQRNRRIAGSGVGGGTLVGLSSLLLGRAVDYRTLTNLAAKGSREEIDLTVADIYRGAKPPIPGDLTAANFAMVPWHPNRIADADKVAAVTGLVAETVTMMSLMAAVKEKADTIVYIGSTLAKNPPMCKLIARYSRLYGVKPIIPESGMFSGAVGARLLAKKTDE